MLAGQVVVQTPGEAARLGPGGYGLIPIGVPHSLRNEGDEEARFVRVSVPVPRPEHDFDTQLVPALSETEAIDADVRDPRTRRYGQITEAHMDPTRQSQELLDVSASMRTALLVYSGISLKMMVDSDLGAVLSSMFMVQYEPHGAAGLHDHPLEETYLILDGTVEATFDGEVYELEPGDVAWAGVGCQHSFKNGEGTVRWLETQAPPLPRRHRLPLRPGLGLPAQPTGGRRPSMRTVVIGGTSGIGLEVARARVARGDEVVLTGRSLDRAESVAALHRGHPHAAAAHRQERLSIVLFGGLAKDRPYPGSTTVSTVNGGVTGMVHTLAVELAPIRVNAVHPGIIADTPFWEGKPLGPWWSVPLYPDLGRTATTDEVVGATEFLLSNGGVNGVNLAVDGGLVMGWMREFLRVAVVGTGRMGAAMAGRLRAQGVPVTVFNRTGRMAGGRPWPPAPARTSRRAPATPRRPPTWCTCRPRRRRGGRGGLHRTRGPGRRPARRHGRRRHQHGRPAHRAARFRRPGTPRRAARTSTRRCRAASRPSSAAS